MDCHDQIVHQIRQISGVCWIREARQIVCTPRSSLSYDLNHVFVINKCLSPYWAAKSKIVFDGEGWFVQQLTPARLKSGCP